MIVVPFSHVAIGFGYFEGINGGITSRAEDSAT